MHSSVLLLCILPLVRGYDLAVGLNNYGASIFNETKQASPAIWRQKENVTITAKENEVITKVIVIDMRPEKDGDARIVDGGLGEGHVTIELRSPTVFRGYDFHIAVYSASKLNDSNGSFIRPARTAEGENNTGVKIEASNSDNSNLTMNTNTNGKTTLITESDVPASSTEESVPGTSVSEVVTHHESSDATDQYKTTTVRNSGTETASTTVPPEISNGKDIPELIAMKREETRRAREVLDEMTSTDYSLDTTTETSTSILDASNENDTETYTAGDGLKGETRLSRGTQDSYTTTATNIAEVGTDLTTTTTSAIGSDVEVQGTTDSNMDNDMRHVRHANTDPNDPSTGLDEQTTTEVYSGDGGDTSDTPDLISTPDGETSTANTDALLVTESNMSPTNNTYTDTYETSESSPLPQDLTPSSIFNQMLRNPREAAEIGSSIFGGSGYNNSFYPVFVNQSQPFDVEQTNANDFVYVPLIALVSKSGYPSFQQALQNLPGQKHVDSSASN